MNINRKRGRPPKATTNQKALEVGPRRDAWYGHTDTQVLHAVHDRFDILESLGKGTIKGDVRSLIISGAPGIAKTHTVETMLETRAESYPSTFRYTVIKGNVSPVNLFKILQDYQYPGNVVVLDDADSIFFDDNGVSLLKTALDSTPRRVISWLAESAALRENGEQVYEKTFDYRGSMIFITNTDFQGIVDEGKSKLAPHFAALLSRSMYLDLKVHDRRAVSIWVKYIVEAKNILVYHYGISKDLQREAVDWIVENRDIMRTLSIRDAMKIGQMMKSDYSTWKRVASVLLLRTNM